jgi:hypothetical protein
MNKLFIGGDGPTKPKKTPDSPLRKPAKKKK